MEIYTYISMYILHSDDFPFQLFEIVFTFFTWHKEKGKIVKMTKIIWQASEAIMYTVPIK